MTNTSSSIPQDLEMMLRIDEACGFNHSVVDSDGTVYGWAAHTPPVWLKVPPPADGWIEICAGDQWMFKVRTMAEAESYIYGVLMGFCGGDFERIERCLMAMKDADTYARMIELHKLGWCPIWNSR